MEFVIKRHFKSLFHFDLVKFCSGDPSCIKCIAYTDEPNNSDLLVANVPERLIVQLDEEQLEQLKQRC